MKNYYIITTIVSHVRQLSTSHDNIFESYIILHDELQPGVLTYIEMELHTIEA